MADARCRRRTTLHSNLQTETDRYTFPGLGGWIECEQPVRSLCREFKTALNAEMYLDCIKQKCFRDCLVHIRLGISNLKVHKNRYARSDVPQGNHCPFCPGMQDNELHLFFVCKKYEKIRPNIVKYIEPHHEHSQSVKFMSCQVDSVTRQMAWFLFKCFETRNRGRKIARKRFMFHLVVLRSHNYLHKRRCCCCFFFLFFFFCFFFLGGGGGVLCFAVLLGF